MSSLLMKIRSRFHPIFYLRKTGAYRLLSHLKIDVRVKDPYSGLRVHVDMVRNASLILSRFETSEVPERLAFSRVVELVDARRLWDVGANIGVYALEFLSKGEGRHVLAFEPDDYNARLLRKTLAANAGLSLEIIEMAVGAQEGEASFLVDDISGATGSLDRPDDTPTFNDRHFDLPTKSVRVMQTTVDAQIAAGRAAPDFLKIDVEGGEAEVFAGAAKLLNTAPPAIFYESGRDGRAVMGSLEAYGYRHFDMSTLEPTTEPRHNLLALHVERHRLAIAAIANR